MPLQPQGADEPTETVVARLGPAGTALAAAMLGLGEVLEPEKVKVTIEQTDGRPDGDDPLIDLTFGDLPPLDTN